MNRKLFYTLGALVLMLSMVLAACAPAAGLGCLRTGSN
jgi:predicted small secreted protein